jgi:hypothetical protein
MMTYTSARNPQRGSDGGITLLVTFDSLGEVPFGCIENDSEAHGRDIFARCVAGEFGTIADYVAPIPTTAQLIAAIEKQRDDALSAGFLHNGFLYHCDPTFQSQLQAFLLAWAVGMLAPTATVPIRRRDNVTETMTKDQVGALAGALMAYVQGVYAASWVAKDAL